MELIKSELLKFADKQKSKLIDYAKKIKLFDRSSLDDYENKINEIIILFNRIIGMLEILPRINEVRKISGTNKDKFNTEYVLSQLNYYNSRPMYTNERYAYTELQNIIKNLSKLVK